jgi:hypothetical protein
MKKIKYRIGFIIVLIFFSFCINTHAAEYKTGWDYINFYQAVEKCRDSVVYQQIKAYGEKGLKNNQDIKTLRNEMISITPVMDFMATDVCFCTINEIAKDVPLKQFVKGIDYNRYMNIQRCQNNLNKAMNTLQDDRLNLQLE